MKKICIFCLFFLSMIGVYYISYTYSVKYFGESKNEYNILDIPTQAVDSNNENIITNLTEFVVERYNIDTKELTEEKIATPVDYLGYNREKLIQALRKYLASPSQKDKAQGIISYELASFTNSKVVVRKSYSTADLQQVYYIFVKNGYLVIYMEDKETLFDNTNIKLSSLPESVQREVISGKRIEHLNDLYEFLQTYSS